MTGAASGLTAELTRYLDEYFDAWNAYDVSRMRAMWDEDEEDVLYQAEESEEAAVGWKAILAYWSVDRSRAERLLTWERLHAVLAGPDVAVAFFHANWSTYIPDNRLYPKPFGGPVRINMVLRRKPSGWRAIHYAESPLAAIIQMRKAYEDAVDPRLHARLRAKGIRY